MQNNGSREMSSFIKKNHKFNTLSDLPNYKSND